jgi:glutaconate CoA-transferase subunit A
MINTVSSKIKNISTLQYKEKKFEYWGPTPDEARKKMVEKSHAQKDKRVTLKEAVATHIKDGINLGIGGFVNTRVPVAIIHEIIRHGARDLTLSFQSNSICPELLAGAMILDPDRVSIRRVELAWWGYEIIGIAPLVRYLSTNGIIEMDDYTNYGMSVRFKAAAMGIPFIPVRDHGGSDMELVNRGKMIECPFTGKNVYLLPACQYVWECQDFWRPLHLSGNCHGRDNHDYDHGKDYIHRKHPVLSKPHRDTLSRCGHRN